MAAGSRHHFLLAAVVATLGLVAPPAWAVEAVEPAAASRPATATASSARKPAPVFDGSLRRAADGESMSTKAAWWLVGSGGARWQLSGHKALDKMTGARDAEGRPVRIWGKESAGPAGSKLLKVVRFKWAGTAVEKTPSLTAPATAR